MIAPYSVTKTALFGLTRALSNALADENIRVNAIAPGVIKTKFAAEVRICTVARTCSYWLLYVLLLFLSYYNSNKIMCLF